MQQRLVGSPALYELTADQRSEIKGMRARAQANLGHALFPYWDPWATRVIVQPSPLNPDRPAEQLLLLRTLEIVQSIHGGLRVLAEGLRDIKANLPVQRRPLSKRAQQIHIMVTATRRNGLWPCCQETPVCTEVGRLPGAEYNHYFARNQNRVTQTWLVCGGCNEQLLNTDFKVGARSSFEIYQAAVRPILNRQQAFPAAVLSGKGE